MGLGGHGQHIRVRVRSHPGGFQRAACHRPGIGHSGPRAELQVRACMCAGQWVHAGVVLLIILQCYNLKLIRVMGSVMTDGLSEHDELSDD